MEKLTLMKPDGNLVSCFLEVPDSPEGVVIAVHGFSSSKECSTYQVLFRKLPKARLGVLGIDLPGHGREESYRETLRIESCKNSIEAAEKWVLEHYPGLPVYYFASSFGAYVTALYLSTREHAGRRAFFRSAAVNMPSLFIKDNPTEEEREKLRQLEENGYYYHSLDDRHQNVRITREFYRDLEENDLFERFAPNRYGENKAAMAHGTDDTVIDPEKAKAFAEKFHLPIYMFENEGHSLGNAAETPDRVADLAADFWVSGT